MKVAASWINSIPSPKAPCFSKLNTSLCKDTIFVTVGPKGGVGQLFGWGIPSLMVKKGKSEKFLVDLVDPYVTGTKWD